MHTTFLVFCKLLEVNVSEAYNYSCLKTNFHSRLLSLQREHLFESWLTCLIKRQITRESGWFSSTADRRKGKPTPGYNGTRNLTFWADNMVPQKHDNSWKGSYRNCLSISKLNKYVKYYSKISSFILLID